MVIGFDASRAFVTERTGTENYSYYLLRALVTIDRENQYYVYTGKVSRELRVGQDEWPSNFRFVEIPLKKLWTQIGLAYRTWIDRLDLLFVPAHTLPVFKKPGLKTIVTIHDLGYEYLPSYHQFPQKYYLNWSTVYASGHSAKLIAVSKATKNDLISKLKCNPHKIEVIYEGVEAGKYQRKYEALRVKYVLEKYAINGNYLLSVGTIQPRKNYKRLIEAFTKISNSMELVIVGKKGWMWEEIIETPKKYGLQKKVKFLEYILDDDLIILYQNARCLVQPSLFEGFGLPILEAMASGCPVVTSNRSSLPEVVGDAGILVDPYNIDSIIDGIHKIISDQNLRDVLIAKGKNRVKEFAWEKAASRTLALFIKVKSESTGVI